MFQNKQRLALMSTSKANLKEGRGASVRTGRSDSPDQLLGLVDDVLRQLQDGSAMGDDTQPYLIILAFLDTKISYISFIQLLVSLYFV